MANRPALITQAELKRSIEGVKLAGLRIGRVEIDHRTGKVVIVTEGADDALRNPCDRLLP